MKEAKKKYINNIEKNKRKIFFTDNLEGYWGSKNQIIIGEGLLKERNGKHYYSSARPGPLYKLYEKCVYVENVKSICRISSTADEKVAHFVSEYSKLVQEYKRARHDNIAKMIHWNLCEKW